MKLRSFETSEFDCTILITEQIIFDSQSDCHNSRQQPKTLSGSSSGVGATDL